MSLFMLKLQFIHIFPGEVVKFLGLIVVRYSILILPEEYVILDLYIFSFWESEFGDAEVMF